MINTLRFLPLIAILFICSCEEPLDPTLLHGEWQADEYLASGKPKKTDPKLIGFTFAADQTYTYKGGFSYKEAGQYRLERSILYSTDTLSDQRIEKAVKIARITADSLYLEMNNGGIEEELVLHKVK